MRADVAAAAASVAVTTVLGVAGWMLVPGKWTAWLFVILFPALLWAWIEAVSTDETEAARAIRRLHRINIVVLALYIAVDVAPDLAMVLGVLDTDVDPAVRRGQGILTGVFFVLWGNHLPKIMSPWTLDSEPFDWHGVHRFVGMLLVVAGVALIAVWAFLPAPKPNRAAILIVGVAVLLSVGRKLLSVLRYSAGRRPLVR